MSDKVSVCCGEHNVEYEEYGLCAECGQPCDFEELGAELDWGDGDE